jgi:hypothetical protein
MHCKDDAYAARAVQSRDVTISTSTLTRHPRHATLPHHTPRCRVPLFGGVRFAFPVSAAMYLDRLLCLFVSQIPFLLEVSQSDSERHASHIANEPIRTHASCLTFLFCPLLHSRLPFSIDEPILIRTTGFQLSHRSQGSDDFQMAATFHSGLGTTQRLS